MKQKLVSAVIYAISTLGLWSFFDAVFGAGPVTRHLTLIRVAMVGTALLAIACVLSLINVRLGIFCAVAGTVLLWPYFAIQLTVIPWTKLPEVLPYANWRYELLAVCALVVSSSYSAAKLLNHPPRSAR